MLRRILLTVVAFLGLAAGVVGIAALGEPRVPFVSRKLERWHDVAARTDVVFAGSSRVHRHLDPFVFDRTAAAAGRPLRSFNFGVPAAKAVEVRSILERALETEKASPRWVLLEPDGLTVTIAAHNAATWREVWWHDVNATADSVRSLWSSRGIPPTTALDMSGLHVAAAARRLLRIGWLRALIEDRLRSSPQYADRAAIALGRRRDGFDPHVLNPRNRTSPRRQGFQTS